MPRFAANLSFLYPELPFLDRFAAAAADGFTGVEYISPYENDAGEIAARLRDLGLQQVLFNAALGDWAGGERGIAALPGREAAFPAAMGQAFELAQRLACPRLHVMSGFMPAGAERAALQATFIDNLRWAAAEAGRHGCTLLIEPINPRDMPGYFLTRQDEAHAVVQAVGSAHLKVQMDLYHCQVVEGDLATKLRRWLPSGQVGHLQVAGVPDRHEPSEGELDYDYLLDLVDALGWDGWVGCEYRPRAGTSEGLGWLRRWHAGRGG